MRNSPLLYLLVVGAICGGAYVLAQEPEQAVEESLEKSTNGPVRCVELDVSELVDWQKKVVVGLKAYAKFVRGSELHSMDSLLGVGDSIDAQNLEQAHLARQIYLVARFQASEKLPKRLLRFELSFKDVPFLEDSKGTIPVNCGMMRKGDSLYVFRQIITADRLLPGEYSAGYRGGMGRGGGEVTVETNPAQQGPSLREQILESVPNLKIVRIWAK